MTYAVALALTLVIEVPISVGLLRFWLGQSLRRTLLLTIAGNLLTHPIVWFVTPMVPVDLASPDLVLTIAEVLAMIAEALVLRIGVRRSFSALLIVTFLANAASLLIGSALV